MIFSRTILLSILFMTMYLIHGFFFTEKPESKDEYLPLAQDALVKRLEQEAKAGEGGETFPGLDENSNFVRELKAKPMSRIYTEYGYVSPERLRKEGDVKGSAMVKRPDGKSVRALIIDYKGQLYDGDSGFPCFLSGDTLNKLGIRISYF